MGHSYTSNFIHCVFSTRERSATIPADLEEQLWADFAGVARNHDIELLAAGGTQNHVHVLIALPAAMPLSEAINKLKANSSRWIGEHGVEFAWQEGYGAFSVSASQLPVVKDYIHHQHEHHKKRDFEQEFAALLQHYGVRYDPQHVFG